MKWPRPPRLAFWLLETFAADVALVGDIIEEFAVRRSRVWVWRQVVLAVAVGQWSGRGQVRRYPLGLGELPFGEFTTQALARSAAINLSTSPIPHAGGLGLLALAAIVAVVRPTAVWLLLPILLCGVLLGVGLAIVRHRRLSADSDASVARLALK